MTLLYTEEFFHCNIADIPLRTIKRMTSHVHVITAVYA